MTIHNVEFQPIKNRFLSKLKEHVNTIKNTKELLVNTNRLSKIYQIDRDTYSKHRTENITKTYQKSNRNKVSKINIDTNKIVTMLKLDDRIQQFINIKDHR